MQLAQRLLLSCGLAAALGSCMDHDAAAPSPSGLLHLSLSANVVASTAAASRSVDIRVYYLRAPNDESVLLFSQTFDVDAGAKQLPVAVDLGPCLNDPNRASGDATNACAIRVAVMLRDLAGTVVDSQAVGPIDAAPGGTASIPAFTLREGTTIAAVSGAQQVTLLGRPLLVPVVIKVTDRSGAAVPNRALTVIAVSGGGKVTTQSRVTDAQGNAQITGLEVGTAAGPNVFRVELSGSGSSGSLTVTADAVPTSQQTLAAGARFTCLARASAQTLCWGTNLYGAVGDGTGIDRLLPVPVASSAMFTSLTASTSNITAAKGICGLTVTGQAYCWGTNVDGHLGFVSTDTCPRLNATAPIPTCAKSPQAVAGSFVFSSIGVGAGTGSGDNSLESVYPMRVCGVTPAGDALCWGQNLGGGLGIGNFQSTSTPTPVVGGHKFVRVAVGDATTCGLTATEEIYCWGASSLLGTGSTTNASAPVRVASAEKFIDVGVGSFQACALNRDRALFCWAPSATLSLVPTRIATSVAFAHLSVGRNHACGLNAAGEAYCWTFTATQGGELGDGTTDASAVPTAVVGGLRFREISVGGGDTCAIELSGVLYCWGRNISGALGTGDTEPSSVPVRVNISGLPAGAASQVTAGVALNLPPAAVGSVTRINPTVRVTDVNGIPVAGVTVSFSVTSGGGSVSPAATVTNASGIATTTFRVGTNNGPNAVQASAAGLGGSPLTFTSSETTAGAPVNFGQSAVAQTRNVVVGTALLTSGDAITRLPAVTVTDANQLAVNGALVTFTRRTARGGTITPALPATVRTNVDGIAALSSWVVDTLAGVDTISVTVQGASGEALFAVTARPGGATTLRFLTEPATARAGDVISPPVRVLVTDRWGNTVTSSSAAVTLTLSSGQPGVTLGGTTTVNAVAGIATFADLTVSAPGSFQIRASGVNLAPILGSAFTITP